MMRLLHNFNFQLTIPLRHPYSQQNLFSGIAYHYAFVLVTNPKHWTLYLPMPSLWTLFCTYHNNKQNLKNTNTNSQKNLKKKNPSSPKLKQTNQPPPHAQENKIKSPTQETPRKGGVNIFFLQSQCYYHSHVGDGDPRGIYISKCVRIVQVGRKQTKKTKYGCHPAVLKNCVKYGKGDALKQIFPY